MTTLTMNYDAFQANSTYRKWLDYADDDGLDGWTKYIVGGKQSVNVPPIDRVLKIADVIAFLQDDGLVDGLPVCIKMTPAQYAGDVPVGISNRLDSEGSVIKWSAWRDDTHSHMDANDGDKLVFGNSFGVELTSDELSVLLGEGYTLMMAHEAPQYYPEAV